MEETWKPIPGYDNRYLASNLGRIKLVNGGKGGNITRVLPSYKTKAGYEYVKMWVGKHHLSKFVHTLVEEAFVGVCPEGSEVDHVDKNRGNNTLENLRYREILLNRQDADRTKMSRRKKITAEDIQHMVELFKAEQTTTAISDNLDISAEVIGVVRQTYLLLAA